MHIWYLATDFQFHMLMSVIILVLLYNQHLGNLLNLLVSIVMAVIAGVITYVNYFPPTSVNTARE